MIAAIFTGFIVGLLARALMPGKDAMGFVVTTLLGIGGALVAHLIGRSLGYYQGEETAGIFASIIGALLILGIYGRATRRRANEA
jgi:uncharacterized membrane protein YeaQ/YmgE (transglycosylase-associated protein family)